MRNDEEFNNNNNNNDTTNRGPHKKRGFYLGQIDRSLRVWFGIDGLISILWILFSCVILNLYYFVLFFLTKFVVKKKCICHFKIQLKLVIRDNK